MIWSLYLLSVTPRRFVIHTEKERAAQITARLLAERHPGMAFGYEDGPDFRHGDCHPSIRDSALSVEVQQLVAAETVYPTPGDVLDCFRTAADMACEDI